MLYWAPSSAPPWDTGSFAMFTPRPGTPTASQQPAASHREVALSKALGPAPHTLAVWPGTSVPTSLSPSSCLQVAGWAGGQGEYQVAAVMTHEKPEQTAEDSPCHCGSPVGHCSRSSGPSASYGHEQHTRYQAGAGGGAAGGPSDREHCALAPAGPQASIPVCRPGHCWPACGVTCLVSLSLPSLHLCEEGHLIPVLMLTSPGAPPSLLV